MGLPMQSGRQAGRRSNPATHSAVPIHPPTGCPTHSLAHSPMELSPVKPKAKSAISMRVMKSSAPMAPSKCFCTAAARPAVGEGRGGGRAGRGRLSIVGGGGSGAGPYYTARRGRLCGSSGCCCWCMCQAGGGAGDWVVGAGSWSSPRWQQPPCCSWAVKKAGGQGSGQAAAATPAQRHHHPVLQAPTPSPVRYSTSADSRAGSASAAPEMMTVPLASTVMRLPPTSTSVASASTLAAAGGGGGRAGQEGRQQVSCQGIGATQWRARLGSRVGLPGGQWVGGWEGRALESRWLWRGRRSVHQHVVGCQKPALQRRCCPAASGTNSEQRNAGAEPRKETHRRRSTCERRRRSCSGHGSRRGGEGRRTWRRSGPWSQPPGGVRRRGRGRSWQLQPGPCWRDTRGWGRAGRRATSRQMKNRGRREGGSVMAREFRRFLFLQVHKRAAPSSPHISQRTKMTLKKDAGNLWYDALQLKRR